jgi:hypothetical protein
MAKFFEGIIDVLIPGAISGGSNFFGNPLEPPWGNNESKQPISDADGTRVNDTIQPIQPRNPSTWGPIPDWIETPDIYNPNIPEQKDPGVIIPEDTGRQDQINKRRQPARDLTQQPDEKAQDYDGGDFDYYNPANPQFENDPYYDPQGEEMIDISRYQPEPAPQGPDWLNRLRNGLVGGGFIAAAGASEIERQRIGINNVDRIATGAVPWPQNPLFPGPNENPNFIPPPGVNPPQNRPDDLDPASDPTEKIPIINVRPINSANAWIQNRSNNYQTARWNNTPDVDMCCC